MRRIGPYFACWVVLNIFEERNGINHRKNRSNAEQGPLGSWTAIDKSTLHCNGAHCLSLVYLNMYVYSLHLSIFCMLVWVEQRLPGS